MDHTLLFSLIHSISIQSGWQTISPHNQVYKSKMHQISVNLVDIIDIDSDRG